MEIKKIMKNTSDFFDEHVAPVHKITAVEQTENEGWKLVVEVIEEKEYMKRYAKDEMVGVYDVYLNKNAEIISFVRREIRYRSAVNIEQ
ncbi:gas vesicle protein GvpO [Jeotgalibacillus terrae]|uniref:Gas vesicle protein GvpO n=1 Tax=Jeotgalibacillus terrae TaxID=587735 RepID=A0ABW5ZCV9_9BACL|nr:gas vesicle protein GvpO [Jeotgalibacillus terrae]MBM7579069.1 hypothetical protein [Jeotgalibacillus terrae]